MYFLSIFKIPMNLHFFFAQALGHNWKRMTKYLKIAFKLRIYFLNSWQLLNNIVGHWWSTMMGVRDIKQRIKALVKLKFYEIFFFNVFYLSRFHVIVSSYKSSCGGKKLYIWHFRCCIKYRDVSTHVRALYSPLIYCK